LISKLFKVDLENKEKPAWVKGLVIFSTCVLLTEIFMSYGLIYSYMDRPNFSVVHEESGRLIITKHRSGPRGTSVIYAIALIKNDGSKTILNCAPGELAEGGAQCFNEDLTSESGSVASIAFLKGLNGSNYPISIRINERDLLNSSEQIDRYKEAMSFRLKRIDFEIVFTLYALALAINLFFNSKQRSEVKHGN